MKLKKSAGWDESELEDLLEYYIGGDWGKDPSYEDISFELAYCIRGSEIRNWNEDKGKTASLRKIKKSNIDNRKLIEGDILVEISGGGPEQPVGRTVLIDKAALNFNPAIPKICTNFLRLIRPKESINSRFLDLYLKLFYNSGEIVNLQNGSNNLRNLKFPEFLKLQIPFPLPDQQHQIVEKIEELFSELDKGIENLKTAQQQLKIYRQAVLKWAFEGKFTDENVKDGELPEGWRMANIGDYLKCIVPNRDKPKSFTGNIPWLTTPDLDDDSITVKFSKVKNGLTAEETMSYKAKVVPANSVVMTCVGKFGIAVVLTKPSVINQQLHAFLPSADFDSKYVAYNIKNQKAHCETRSTSTTIAYLNKGNCNSIPIPFCSITQQKEIVQEIESRLSVCDKMEETITNGLQQAEALRQSILKRAFEGKLVNTAQPIADAKVVPLNNYRDVFERKVLACWIILMCYKDKHFGHTKFQKTLFLCENYAQLNFDTGYLKKAAGPLDTIFFYNFLREAKANEWIAETQKGPIIYFEPLDAIGELTKHYLEYFKPAKDKVAFVIKLLQEKNTDESELIATIYAIWNNSIIQGNQLDDASLVAGVYDWSESKAKFKKSSILSTWQWMKEVGLVPVGFGKLIDKVA